MTAPDSRRLRAALDARILNQSDDADPFPLRRRLAYQRLLRRLGEHHDGGWVLKGGYLLEVRLQSRARATKDLDLAMRTVDTGADVAALLRAALLPDPDGDHFDFTVSRPIALTTDLRGNRAWRVTIEASLDGRTFASLRLDLVERLDEIANATESILIPVPITGVDLADARITAVDIAQHAAEKFHALCAGFSDGRQNTRVKDLVDIVLLAESGLLPHADLPARIRAVFDARDAREPPASLPIPPASWRADYLLLATTTGAGVVDVDAAFRLASALFEFNQQPY